MSYRRKYVKLRVKYAKLRTRYMKVRKGFTKLDAEASDLVSVVEAQRNHTRTCDFLLCGTCDAFKEQVFETFRELQNVVDSYTVRNAR